MARTQLNRRRFLQSGLAASAALAAPPALRAKAKAPAVQEATNLKVMVWGRPDTANWLASAAQRVGAGNYTIEPVIGGSGDGEVAEQFRLMLSAGGDDMPDIIRFNRIQVPEFAEAGVLYDMTSLIEPYRADMIESARRLATYGEQVVAIPAQLKSKVWYYRQDLFEQAGINPDDVVTFDDFVAKGKEFHAALPDSFMYNLRAEPPGYFWGGTLTSHAPVSYYDRDAGEWQVTTHPGFRAIFETLEKGKDPELAAPIDDFSPDWSQAFADGVVASSLIAEWMTSFLPGYVPDQAGLWRVHGWPTTGGESNQGSDAGGAVWVIPQGAPNPEAAFELLATTNLTKDGSLALLELGGLTPYVTSAREVVPTMPKPEASADNPNPIPWAPEFFGEDYFEVVLAAEERLTWVDYDPAGAREVALTGEWTQRFMAGETDVDGALEGLQNDLDGQIGNPWEV